MEIYGFISFASHFYNNFCTTGDTERAKKWLDLKVGEGEENSPLFVFEKCLKEMLDTSNSYPYRKKAYDVSTLLYNCYEEISNVYIMAKYISGMAYADRFTRRDAPVPVELPIFTDKYDRPQAPEECGLYLVGDVKANPLTFDLLYCVKVGRSSNLNKRMNQYYTENPLPWFADFLEASDDIYVSMEHNCHQMLKSVAYARAGKTNEWFFVDRATYLEICEKGFHYFFNFK